MSQPSDASPVVTGAPSYAELAWLARETGVLNYETLPPAALAVEIHVVLCRLLGRPGYGMPEPLPEWIDILLAQRDEALAEVQRCKESLHSTLTEAARLRQQRAGVAAEQDRLASSRDYAAACVVPAVSVAGNPVSNCRALVAAPATSEDGSGELTARLIFDPAVSDDSPVIKGTWVTASHVISLLVDGWSWADILRAHPEINEDDIRACTAYTATSE